MRPHNIFGNFFSEWQWGYVVFVEEDEELVWLVYLADKDLLEEVVGQTHYLDCLGAAQLQGG